MNFLFKHYFTTFTPRARAHRGFHAKTHYNIFTLQLPPQIQTKVGRLVIASIAKHAEQPI